MTFFSHIKLFVIALSIAGTSVAQAESSLEQQERETAHAISNANFISQFAGRYKAARNEHFFGSHGIKKKSENYLQGFR